MVVMKNKFHPVLKFISIVLVHTFILSSIAFAAPQDPAQQGTAQPALSKEQVTNPENIIIPKEFGVVKLSHKADGDKLIINIQDAHCNYEAQTNIAKMIETLVKNDNLALVSVEGADGVIDTSWFKAFPDDEIRRQVADYFMKKGEITGPEFLSITTDYPIKLFGAETRSYYIENLNAFTSSYPLKDETEKYFNTIKAALNKLKALIYNDDLKRMDSKSDDYESKKLSFNEYVRFLQSEAEKNKINLRQYDNLFKLINVLIYEKKIDFNVTDKERSSLIDALSKKISKDSITELVSKSMAFKVGKISSVEYYNYLKSLAAMTGMDMAKDYSNLYNYIIYNSVYSRIDNEKLFKDIAAIESAIKEKLFTNDDQRMLEKLSRHINMLIGLVNIKLLNDDFDYYSAHRDEFSDETFSEFITKKAAQFGLALAIDPPSEAVAKNIPKLEDFYTIAIKRDKALVENTLAQMDKDGQKLAVLVTGGFHSEGMSRLLEKQGVSFMVVCPTITKDVPTRYIQVLTNQRTSFDDIVMGVSEQTPPAQGQGTLAPVLVTWARQQDTATLDLFSGVVQNLRHTMDHLNIGTPRERVEAVLDEFDYTSLVELIRSALRFAEGKHLLIRDESVVLLAIEQAYDKHLDELVEARTITADSAAQCRETVRSENFKKEFHKAFLTAQAPELHAGMIQVQPKVTQATASASTLTSEQLKLIDEAAKIFSLTDANKMYLAQMWAQHLMRRKGVETKESLRIVTDRSRIGAPDYKPDTDGNFILGSTLTDEEVKKMLGAFQYTQLKADPQNAAASRKAVITVSSMDGGIGESLNRLAFRKKLAERLNLPVDKVKLSAKGTDLGFDVAYQGKEVFVSIAEAKLMQLVIMAESKKFTHVRFQPLVNWQSKESYDNLLDKTICITDRVDKDRAAKRTYRELLEGNGIEILPMVEQADLPAIEDKTGNVSLSLQAPRQPGGHGNFGFYFLYEEYFNAPPEDGNAHIRIFYNGDNVNSSADEYIAGAMIRNNWPIVKLTTVATPIDVKGGKDGVRVVRRNDGTLIYVPDQMEIADAKAMKQVDIFEKAGQEDGFGAAGRQPFNTNIFYINSSLLHSILQDLLKEGVVTEAQFYELISPTLITKPAKTGKDGEKYVPIDGAIGTAMHNLNAFFATNTDPRVGEILKRHGVDRMLYFVDIPRTAFFTPVKKTYDMWLQSFSDYYKPLNTTTWKLEDSREAMTPPEFDLQALDEKGKETYWDELQNMIDSLGYASTKDLKSLTIKGVVLLADATLTGEVAIDNKSGKPVNLNEALPQYKQDGRLVLGDVAITIDENGVIAVTPKDSVGALRATGGELTASEHGMRGAATEQVKDEASVNGVIASRISDGMAYALFENTRPGKGDIRLAVSRPAGIEESAWAAFITEIENLGINVIVIKGLKARLAELGVATDLFMHPGMGRRAVYLDEEDLAYLLSLPQGWRLATEAVVHEKGHIENPSLSEAAVERAYPSYNVRLALTLKAAEPRRDGVQVVSRRFQQDGVYEYTDADGVEVSGTYRKPLAQFAEFGTAGVRWLVPGSLKTLETQYPDVARYIKSNGYEQEDFTKPNVAIIAKAIALYNQRKAMGYYRPVTGTTETFVERLNKGIVIAYDNRPNNIAYAKTIARVLTAYGVKAVLARVDGKDAAVSVPAVSLMVKREGYAGSIILTASHNGDMWNGIKFETEEGGQALSPVTGAIGTILREELSLEQPNYLETEESVDTLIARGTIATVDPVDYYVMSVLDFMGKDRVDLIRRAISEGNVSLKFSAFYGSSGVIMKKLFEKLGLPAKDLIQVDKPGADVFIASYEPTLERLPELKKIVSLTGRQAKAAGKSTVVLGGAADNDADRFQVNQYNPLTGTVEEFLPGRLAAVLGHYFVSSRNIKDGSFGRSFVSSHYQDSIAKLFGMSVNEQPTGFKYNNNGDNIYGEESYGMSVKGWTLDKDGILPTLLALELVATTGKSLSQYEQEVVDPQLVKAGLPTGYAFKRYDLALNKDAKDKAVAAFTGLYKKIADALKQGEMVSFAGKKVTGCNYDPKKFSGWRFDMEDGSWVALRTSGTEPIIRFYRETLDKKSAEQVDDAFFSLTGLLKPKSESKDVTPGAEQYEDAIYNTYVKGDKEKLQALLLSYGISLGDIENQTFILPIDDRLVSREDEITLEQNVNKYFNGKLIVVRGRDRQLLENLRSIDLQALGHYKIISGISSQTLAAIGDRDRAEFGTILNIDVPEGTFLSPIALVDVMIRIGLQSSNEVILGRMKEIFRKADGGTLTADDITQLVTMTNYLLKLSPVKEIKTEDMPEANLAVRAALKSL